MSWRDRFRAWRQARSRRAAGEGTVSLREFVYLDDVSVYSLRASQVGPIVTELSETQASSLQSEIKSSAGGTVGLAKGEISSGIQTNESQGSQVLRKALIQSTFKELYDDAKHILALAPPDALDSLPPVNSAGDLIRTAEDDYQNWVIPSERLKRGELLEVEVHLEAEPIFHAGAIVSAVHEIIKEDPTVFGLEDISQLGEVRVISRMLEKLLAGLVPVRGQLLDYTMIDHNGRELLVHRDLAERVPEGANGLRPFVVGVADRSLFWKDVRRVLFSGSSYRVLGRVARSGFQPSWTPVKLVEVMREVLPDFADIIDEMNHGVLPAMTSAVAGQQADPKQVQVQRALLAYAELLVDRTGGDISAVDVISETLRSVTSPAGGLTIQQWRELFAPITSLIEQSTGTTVDRALASECRVAAITTAGLLPGDASKAPPPSSRAMRRSIDRYLDTEIVAVYW